MNILSSLLKSALALAAIVFAAAGQYVHTYYRADLLALGLFSVALIIWIIVVLASPISLKESQITNLSIEPTRHVSRTLILSAVVLSIFAFAFSINNQITIDNLLAWVGSIVAFLYTCLNLDPAVWSAWLQRQVNFVSNYVVQVPMLIGIVLIGVFFCGYDLDTLPSKTDARQMDRVLAIDNVANSSYAPIFFDQVPGGEPMQFYLTAAFARFTNSTVDMTLLKTVTAIMGVLLIPLLFLLTRELFGGDIALIVAFLAAISKWTITIARMGLPFILAPIFLVATMLFLVRAFKYSQRNDFLFAGLFLGAGLYGYSAFRIVPLLVFSFSFLWLARVIYQRRNVRRYMMNTALMFAMVLVVAMPLLRYATEQPKQIAFPIINLVDPDTSISDNSGSTLALNLVNAVSMFNWTGDADPVNAVPNDPALDYVTGALFLLGVIYALFRMVGFRESVYAFLLIGLVVLILPSAMNLAHPTENPSLLRAAGAIPFAVIIAAFPLAWLVQSIRSMFPDTRIARVAAVVIVVVLLFVSARANYRRYFNDYAAHDHQSILDFRLSIFDPFVVNQKSKIENSN